MTLEREIIWRERDMVRQRRIDTDVMERFDELAARNVAATSVHKALEKEFRHRAPALRTVQEMVQEARAADASPTWSMSAASPEEAAAVLPVLAEMRLASGGARTSVTKLEAAWISRIRAIAPDLRPQTCYDTARAYIARGARGESTDGLDAFLGMAPWRDVETSERYFKAVRERVFQGPGIRLSMYVVQALGVPLGNASMPIEGMFSPGVGGGMNRSVSAPETYGYYLRSVLGREVSGDEPGVMVALKIGRATAEQSAAASEESAAAVAPNNENSKGDE